MDKVVINKVARYLEFLARELEEQGLVTEMEQICQIVYKIDFDYLDSEFYS